MIAREICDWTLEDVMARPPAILGVAFVSRLDPRYRLLQGDMDELAGSYGSSAVFRVVDLAEHPSLIRKYGFVRKQAVLLFSEGIEFARWEGDVTAGEISTRVDMLLRLKKEIG